MKFKTSSDQEKPPKKKAKRNNIRWDAIYANKISFRFIDKLLSTFQRFFDKIDTSRSPGTSRCTEIKASFSTSIQYTIGEGNKIIIIPKNMSLYQSSKRGFR